MPICKFEDLSHSDCATLVAQARALRAGVQSETDALRKFFKKALMSFCRHLEYFAPLNVSEAAQTWATERGVPTLRSLTKYEERARFGAEKDALLWEHQKPAKDIFDDLVDAGGASDEEILAILKTARIAWILSSENARIMPKKGRRDDPDAAYRQADIKMLWCWTCGLISPDGSGYCELHRR